MHKPLCQRDFWLRVTFLKNSPGTPVRVDAVVGSDFVNRALPLNRLKSDLYLEGGSVGFSLLLFHRITTIGSDFTP